MNINEMDAFHTLLSDAMAYYSKDCSSFTLKVWWNACQNFSLEQVSKALERHATDAERGAFAPKVSDIIRALQGTSTDRAAIAWGKVYGAMSAVGAYSNVAFDDPAIHAVIEDLGGWPKICRTENTELSYVQHSFQESHRAYTERGHFEYSRFLPGAIDPDHEYTRRGLTPPGVKLIGDREKATAVLRNGIIGSKTKISTLAAEALVLVANTGVQEKCG
ncbi:DUF6475 domain-containing protein [Comamonas sp.]|uniref:DUF6475 domain-containing protein n=1 Tax=Comamonas sp. TaxID=34028 RepID=UPI00289F4E90|nr:DUF6475 domain-containing protein [Comamonas sp.]